MGEDFNQKLIQLSERMKQKMKDNEAFKIDFYSKIKANSKSKTNARLGGERHGGAGSGPHQRLRLAGKHGGQFEADAEVPGEPDQSEVFACEAALAELGRQNRANESNSEGADPRYQVEDSRENHRCN